MADISKIQVVEEYNVRDNYARSNYLKKNDSTEQTTGAINFQNGLKIDGNLICPDSTGIAFEDTVDWNFKGGSLKSNGYAVVTVNDFDVNDLVGKKYKVNNVAKGEIVGDYTNNVAAENYSFVTGRGNVSNYTAQLIGGKYNNNKSTSLFEIGNGTDSEHTSNAFEVRNDGAIVCNDVIMPGINGLIKECGKNAKRRITNDSTITVTTSNSTILNETYTAGRTYESYIIGSIPIEMSTDGNVIITITTNYGSKQIKKYCLKGSDLLNFIFTVRTGTTQIKIEIKTEYVNSDIRNIQAQIASLTNYIMYLSYNAPVPDTTLPQGTISASSIDIVLIGI